MHDLKLVVVSFATRPPTRRVCIASRAGRTAVATWVGNWIPLVPTTTSEKYCGLLSRAICAASSLFPLRRTAQSAFVSVVLPAVMLLSVACPAFAQEFDLPSIPPCSNDMSAAPCEVTTGEITLSVIEKILAGRDSGWKLEGDQLTVVARKAGDWALLCCTIQTKMKRLGESDLWAVSVRIPNVETAILQIKVIPEEGWKPGDVWRGSRAPSAPDQVEKLSGQIYTHTFNSESLGGKRKITVYMPPGSNRNVPVVFVADSGSAEFNRIAEALILSKRIPSVAIVGIENAGPPSGQCGVNCDPRAQEYLIDPPEANAGVRDRFDRHQRFLLAEVLPYVEENFPVSRKPKDRILAGFSNGASWALATSSLNQGKFQNVIALSFGWKPAVDRALALRNTHVFLGAGKLESDVTQTRTRDAAANAKKGRGNAVRVEMLNAGHDALLWNRLFADGLTWLFEPKQR